MIIFQSQDSLLLNVSDILVYLIAMEKLASNSNSCAIPHVII